MAKEDNLTLCGGKNNIQWLINIVDNVVCCTSNISFQKIDWTLENTVLCRNKLL